MESEGKVRLAKDIVGAMLRAMNARDGVVDMEQTVLALLCSARALSAAPGARGWTIINEDPETWPPQDEAQIIILWSGRSAGFGRFTSIGTGRKLTDSALKKEHGTMGAAWIAIPPWPALAVQSAAAGKEKK